MSYIRTKDGIYSVFVDDLCQENEIDLSIAGFRTKYCRGLDKPISKEDIVKVADAIEELCDEAVIVDNRPPKTKRLLDNFEKAFMFKNHCRIRNEDIIIYGAIWTDKGLIYVAKMNDKGDLELL